VCPERYAVVRAFSLESGVFATGVGLPRRSSILEGIAAAHSEKTADGC